LPREDRQTLTCEREKHYYYDEIVHAYMLVIYANQVNLIPKGVKHITQCFSILKSLKTQYILLFLTLKKFKNPMNSARFAIELG
jgi:hypothetical protein